MSTSATPAQTVGPFFHDGLLRGRDLAVAVAPGDDAPVVLTGRVLDGAGAPVDDAMVELWRADPDGGADPHGWARSATDADGRYRLVTSAPTSLPHPTGGEQAPHVVLLVFARGLLDQLQTRAYLVQETGDDPPLDDPVLAQVPPERRATLLARRDGTDEDGRPVHRFDIRLQGTDETVFLAV